MLKICVFFKTAYKPYVGRIAKWKLYKTCGKINFLAKLIIIFPLVLTLVPRLYTIFFYFLESIKNVMIIHRPGCAYLDYLVDQLSNMLKSHGLNVDTAFGSDDLSADGGIASYLQRHIQACDYVIVFITKKENGKLNFSSKGLTCADRNVGQFRVIIFIPLYNSERLKKGYEKIFSKVTVKKIYLTRFLMQTLNYLKYILFFRHK